MSISAAGCAILNFDCDVGVFPSRVTTRAYMQYTRLVYAVHTTRACSTHAERTLSGLLHQRLVLDWLVASRASGDGAQWSGDRTSPERQPEPWRRER